MSRDENSSSGEFMLFGVRVRAVDPMRKCLSLNDLSHYDHLPNPSGDDVAAGYVSADATVPHRNSSSAGGIRERKRGIPWTEEEHKLFLLGLQKVGKGDWRGISKNFVKTRTPTQVASHAQKYFLRRSNLNRRRRRSSLFDITTDSVTPTPMEEMVHRGHKSRLLLPTAQLPLPETPQSLHFPMNMSATSAPVEIDTNKFSFRHINQNGSSEGFNSAPTLPVPTQTSMVDFNLNQTFSEDLSPLSLNLSLSLDRVQDQFSRVYAFEVMPSFGNGDSLISVT